MRETIELLLIFMLILAVTAKLLGAWMLPIAQGCAPSLVYAADTALMRLLGIHPTDKQSSGTYLASLLIFNGVGFLALWALLIFQDVLPLNPAGIADMSPYQAFNTVASFVTNTNWQSYAGETGVSILTQMLGMTVQNFVSASTGIAVAFALMRALTDRNKSDGLGHFFANIVRINLWILLPLSLIWAALFLFKGVPQTWQAHSVITALNGQGTGGLARSHQTLRDQRLWLFNANSAHPFENPTALTNFLQCLAIFLISSALLMTFSYMVRDMRQGKTLWAAVAIIFCTAILAFAYFEGEAGQYWI